MIYDSINGKIQYSTGGTNPIFVYCKEDNSFKEISSSQEPIGVEKTTEYVDNELSVKSGDIIVTCTDGLLEALNNDGTQYSKSNLERVIRESRNSDGKEIANKIKNDVKNFCGVAAQHDDQSLLVVKIK